jgi:hypothetical protein
MPRFTERSLPLLLVLLTGAILRFYNYSELPYTHDELSALSRLDYGSFSELIEKGVRPDGHPALVQVFLFYWTKIGGTSEEWVKLPFLLCGLLSIFLVWKIGDKWFGRSAGIFAALFIACSQFFIVYSQYARPYVTGSFFSLLLLNSLFEIWFSEKPSKIHWLIFVSASVLCALNHHISMLFALLAVLIGLFFIPRKKLLNYLICCAIAALLYLPHIGITLSQFSIGGLSDWLGAPGPDFILRFFSLLFHHTWWLILCVFMVIALARIFGEPDKIHNHKSKIRIIFLALFAGSFLITFFYSTLKAPILQYSTLVFSAPCLLLFLFSFMRELRPFPFYANLILIGFCLVFSLAVNRKFFELNYKQAWEQYVLTAERYRKNYPSKKVSAIVRSEKFFIDFYKAKLNSEVSFILEPNETHFNPAQLKLMLDSLDADFIIVGNLLPHQVGQIANYYPVVIEKIAGYNFEVFVLAREGKSVAPLFGIPTVYPLRLQTAELNLDPSKIVSTDTGRKKLTVEKGDEYLLGLRQRYDSAGAREGCYLLAEIEVEKEDTLQGLLCLTIKKDDETVSFNASEIEAYQVRNDKKVHAWASMYVGGDFEKLKREELNVFVWNNKRRKFYVTGFNLTVVDSNPWKYAQFEKIK